MNGRLRSMLALGRWLGPWAGESTPKNTIREEVFLGDARRMRVAVHRPRQPARGVWLVTQGLHPAGPDDPRLDRFCKVLAASGFVTVAPYLPDFLSLVIAPDAANDLGIAFDHAEAIAKKDDLPAPAIFSISFGSLPASALAASERGSRASALVLFGGFCDFSGTVRYAITGRAEHEGQSLKVEHDPLNSPVVHLHLLPFQPPEIDRERLGKAWRDMVVRTWGKPELKIGRAREPHAKAVIDEHRLEGKLRDAFLVGCGLSDGGEAVLEEGLRRVGDAYAWADPRKYLANARTRVAIVHGRDDDVIPYFEAYKIQKSLPKDHPHELHITGMYGHTGSSLPSPGAAIAELRTLLRVLRVLAI